MRISNLRTEPRNSEFGAETALVADVETKKFGKSTIWLSVPQEYESWLTTDRYDGFLLEFMFYAMKNNENIFVDGAVSKRLLRNLNHYAQDVMKTFTPYLNKITVSARETTSQIIPSAKHVGTGFSGGIDSFYTVYDKFVCETDPEYRIDTLLCFNTGHYSIAEGTVDPAFRNIYALLSQYPKEVGLPCPPVSVNYGYYCDRDIYWEEIRQCGISGMAGTILCFQNRFSKYYIASNNTYLELLLYASKHRPVKNMKNAIDGDYMENILYHLLQTESLELIVDGSSLTRTEKTERIANYPPTYKYIEVSCHGIGQKNLTNNWKTNRTLWALESLDKLDLYAESFDIDRWKKKDAFLYKCEQILLGKSNSYARDNIDFAKARGKKVPPYLVAFVCVYFYKKPLDLAKGAVRRFRRFFKI